ncbi:MAG: DUF4384 domain-containing protein [Candidatus Cloacimonetes bacterium]|jgi:hypothetical protein|nr:DUF4384 domain-containing protein [Candidatus Cloacimonadota bacterium]
MVRSRLDLALGLAALLLVLTGCASNKAKPASDAAASSNRAESAFAEMGGKQKPPTNQPRTGSGQTGSETVRIEAAAGGKVSVEVDTFRVFNDTFSLQQAREQTLSFAREVALQRALPADVTINTLLTDMYVERNYEFDEQTAKSIFMLSTSAGRFQAEEVLEAYPVFDKATHSLSYHIRYQAEVTRLPRVYNSAYDLKVSLSNTLLRDGDRFLVSATANSDGYLYIFDFLPDQSVTLTFPTRLYPNNKIEAGEPWTQQLAAVVLPGREHSIETLYFVFAAEPIAGWEDFCSNLSPTDHALSGGEDSFIQFQTWLGRSDPSKRVEKLAQLHIFK